VGVRQSSLDYPNREPPAGSGRPPGRRAPAILVLRKHRRGRATQI